MNSPIVHILSHRFPEILRSFIEGLCFAARECYLAMGEIPEEIRITGGGSQSVSIRKIFSNILIPDCELHLEIQAVRSHGRVYKSNGYYDVNVTSNSAEIKKSGTVEIIYEGV